ncbi:MAG: hypothetical protein AVDCRST_MAG17-922, partial [uncultured Solirubrobacterales bacterium]
VRALAPTRLGGLVGGLGAAACPRLSVRRSREPWRSGLGLRLLRRRRPCSAPVHRTPRLLVSFPKPRL